MSLALLAHLGLFVASLVFLASGQSFEQFRASGWLDAHAWLLLHEGNVILLWAHSGDSYLVGLEAATGKERWRRPVPQGNNGSSLLVVRVEEQAQIVVAG